MKNLFLALAIIGTIVPMAAFAPWVSQHGMDIPLLVKEMMSTHISRFITLDLFCSAMVVFLMSYRGMRKGITLAWLPVIATVVVGVSFGLPLYLFLEAHHMEQHGATPHDG